MSLHRRPNGHCRSAQRGSGPLSPNAPDTASAPAARGPRLHRRLVIAGLLWPAAPIFVRAHGPTPQRIDESIEIAAPPAAVWALVGDFAGFAAWNPALAGSTADKGNTPGSRRTLSMKSGGEVAEELDEHDAAQMSLSYRSARDLDSKVLPASSYSARLRVSPAGSGSKLEWRARAYRADTANEPPPGRDDEAVVKALRAYIQPALQAAKLKLEAR